MSPVLDEAGRPPYAAVVHCRPATRVQSPVLCVVERLRVAARRPRLLALLIVLPLLCGFDVARDGDGNILRWPEREVAVFLHVGTHGALALDQIENAVTRAMKAYNSIERTRLKLVYGGLVSGDPGFDIFVRFSDKDLDQREGELIGRVTLAANSSGTLLRSTVELNGKDVKFGVQPTFLGGPTADLQASLTHMLGRAVGLHLSWQEDATLYFLPTTRAFRTLKSDDIDALRFTYPDPPPRNGDLCDACDGNLDCPGGFCATWREGNKSYCTRSCETHDDCAIGFSCGVWTSGKACFPNARHCDPELAQAGASGMCASDLACPKELFCLAGTDPGFCTAQCSGFCGEFGQCQQVSLGSQVVGLCLKSQAKPAGEPCLVGPECSSLVCAPSINGGFCSRQCLDDASCPTGFKCDGGEPRSFCAKPGALAVGWPCGSGFDCETGQCARSGTGFANVCTTSCNVTTDCPAGTGCTPTDSGMHCLPYGKPPVGSPCGAGYGCSTGLVCDESDLPEIGVCRYACDPFGEGKECKDGGRCAWLGVKSAKFGVCRGGSGLGLAGTECSSTAPCRPDLACVGTTALAGTCQTDCNLEAEDPGCPQSQSCRAVDTTNEEGVRRGVCVDTDAEWLELLPIRVPSMTNFTAKALDMGKDVLPFGSIVKKGEEEPAAGCSVSRTRAQSGGATFAWLLAVALLALTAARRSKGGHGAGRRG